MTDIIGRKKEKVLLQQILDSSRAEFLALYGRRRVGKTFLIKNFFDNRPNTLFFYCSGLQKGKLFNQLNEFSTQLGRTFYENASLKARKNWMDAFLDLTQAIEKRHNNEKIILFFDEMPWMATKRSGFLSALDYYWNRYWSHEPKIKLIVCGSSASWIIQKIINNKGGLYNRTTRNMHLMPFNLQETAHFLNSIGIQLNQKHIVDLYMVFGGIPHYLSLIPKGLSATQAIDSLCFQKDGTLVQEFERMFLALFDKADLYIEVIRLIASQRYGYSQSELLKHKKISNGGNSTQKLQELEDSGFITKFIPYGSQSRGIFYKVTDEFTLFYLSWIEPNLKTILKQDTPSGYWLAKSQSPAWQAWSGYAFEAICHKHIEQIRKALNIDAGADIGTWRYSPKQKEEQGAQIDLLFDRPDDTITLCEIKYNDSPYIIDKAFAQQLIQKSSIYQKHTKTNKQIFWALITLSGIKPSLYAQEIITQVVTIENLF